MKSSTKRILSIGLSALFFIAIIIIYGNLIRPELDKINKKRSVVVSKENLFNNQKTAVEEVQKLINEFQSSAQIEETVSLAMPREENVTQILNQMQAIARNSQANVISFSIGGLAFEPSKQPLAKRLGTLELDISIQGNYEAIKGFSGLLETNVRLVNIQDFRIAPVSSAKPGEFYLLTIKAELYYQEE